MTQANQKRVKVAFLLPSGNEWLGGASYQANLQLALQAYAPEVESYRIKLEGASGNQGKPDLTILHPLATRDRVRQRLGRAVRFISGHDRLLEQELRKRSVNVTFSLVLGQYLGRTVPNVFWIPDFQHEHLPQMFEKHDRQRRKRQYQQGADRATIVALSSQDALKDFCHFIPKNSAKGRLLRFCVPVPRDIYDVDPRDVLVKYKLPEKFVYLPNQFWKHKNHVLVIEALRCLRDRGVEVDVVCSGNTNDRRQPEYFPDLARKIASYGLEGQVKFLGIVPKEHVYQLIRQAVCVLNPSLFEGWSTTVEEAKSIGKRVLLSDIMVHQEQNPPQSVFFSSSNPQDLARKLVNMWNDGQYGPDHVLEGTARSALPDRMQSFARSFVAMISEAIS